ncbi:MAG: hypothetical protein GF307_12795 [candidate division Zixibacteria bacterium]|nr:hypothetical protein [candidate division Zixibacteria bacterium]
MLSDEEFESLRNRLEESLEVRIRPKKIKAIYVNSMHHWQPPMTIEVGKYARGLEKDSPSELVLAIFEATTFLVCTQARGIDKPLPYFFTREDVRRVYEFEE